MFTVRLPTRQTLYNHQVLLHKAGVSHGDVARRNFTKNAIGEIRLIDFDRGALHACPEFASPADPEAHSQLPTLGDVITCPELRKFRRFFGLIGSEEWALSAFEPWDGPPWGS